MKYHFEYEYKNNEYLASCVEIKLCKAQGKNMDDLKENAKVALNLFLSEPDDSNHSFPLPKTFRSKGNIIEVPVDSHVAFTVLLRNARLKEKLSQRKAAARIKTDFIGNYQRLENPEKANPTLKKIAELQKLFVHFDASRIFQ